MVGSHDGAGGGGAGGAGACAGACACAMVIVRPATRRVPFLAAPRLAATTMATVPLPVLFAPPLMEIQSAWLAAVHSQVLPDCTLMESVPPSAGMVVFEALTSNRQAASCVMATC